MLRFIRDLVFPQAYDLGRRSRPARDAAGAAHAHGEKPAPAADAQPRAAAPQA